MNKNTMAYVDADMFKYSIASVGEKRSITVTHNASGNQMDFDTRTDFWGRGKKKDGGWLGERNKERDSPFTADEFTIEDIQTITDPIENILHSAKMQVDSALKNSGIKGNNYKFYLGKGDSFRLDRSTLMKYKGNRDNTLRPLLLDDVVEYLTKKYNAEIITDIEVDDKVIIESVANPNSIVIAEDKDALTCPVKVFNPNKIDDGIVDCTGYGAVYRDDKGKVRGHGIIFKYWQLLAGDTSDNYKPQCFSDVRWGDVAAYNAIKDCRTHKECWQAIVDSYKKLYPETKTIEGWRGDKIEIDWMYVLQEITDLQHMLRWEGDKLVVQDILNTLKVET